MEFQHQTEPQEDVLLSEQRITPRIQNLQDYLDNVLREKLHNAQKVQAEISAEIIDNEDLCRYIRRFIKEGKRDLEMLSDIGNETFVNVYIPDLSRICVSMCHSFYAELSMEEALRFLEEKSKILKERYETQLEMVSITKTEIHIFLQALSTVLNPDNGGGGGNSNSNSSSSLATLAN